MTQPLLPKNFSPLNTEVHCARKETFSLRNLVALLVCTGFGMMVLIGTVMDYLSPTSYTAATTQVPAKCEKKAVIEYLDTIPLQRRSEDEATPRNANRNTFANTDVLEAFPRRFSFQSIASFLFAVDSFFFISGLLVTYLTIKQLERDNGRMSLGAFYFHRFWRLTPSFMFVTMFYATLFRFFGNGPLWWLVQEDAKCDHYWLTNLLYISNFYPVNNLNSCLAWGWYLSCDMQFYLLSPVVFLALYQFRHHGLVIPLILLCASFVATATLTYCYNIRISDFITMAMQYSQTHALDYLNEVYTKPYTRCAPYLVGLALGYVLMLQQKDELTFGGLLQSHRRTLALAGWCVSALCFLTTCIGLYTVSRSFTYLGQGTSVIYSTFSRCAFSVGLAWIVFACQNGYGGVVNRILSAQCWTPLSRLSYNAFLVHPLCLSVYYFNLSQPFYYSDIKMAFLYFGSLLPSFLTAYVVAVLIEMPFIEIEKLFFKRESRRSSSQPNNNGRTLPKGNVMNLPVKAE